ncbi:MAG: NUDIX domain-containing protein [Candidatus Limnocylindrales bacterium]
MTSERVLVVAREHVPERAAWYGLRVDGLDAFLEIAAHHGRFESRAAMELDPSNKQLIPYLVLRDGPRYFLMQRTRAGGDARLHDRWSIGVGGHLNPGDADLFGGLRREWREEVVADFEPDFAPVALLNDDTTEVGAVHLGVVFLADAGGRAVSVRETDKLVGRFADAAEVQAVARDLESWSRLVFEALESGVIAPTPTSAVVGA